MGLLVLPHTYSDNENPLYTDLNNNFQTIYNEFNGSITNANISASAGITFSKLDATSVAGVTAVQTLTNKVFDYNSNTFSNFPNVRSDGWIVSTDTWVQASATSFTIAGVDRTGTFTKGTRIGWTESSTWKYAVVTSSAFSTNTTVNFTGGTDYSMTNTTIGGKLYSYAANPQGYPFWFNYTPTWGGYSTAPTTTTARFSVIGGMCNVNYRISSGGTSNGNTNTVTLPVTASANESLVTPMGTGADNGSLLSGPIFGQVLASSTTLQFCKDGGQSFTGWAVTGAKYVSNFRISYEF